MKKIPQDKLFAELEGLFKGYKKTDERLPNNLKILELLEFYFHKFPHMRFTQGLVDLHIDTENFMEESKSSLSKIELRLMSKEVDNEQSD